MLRVEKVQFPNLFLSRTCNFEFALEYQLRLGTQYEEVDILWSVNIKKKRAYKISPKANFLILSNVDEI